MTIIVISMTLRHPQNISFSKATRCVHVLGFTKTQNQLRLTKSKEIWVVALIPPLKEGLRPFRKGTGKLGCSTRADSGYSSHRDAVGGGCSGLG